jgi:hypothetical protein
MFWMFGVSTSSAVILTISGVVHLDFRELKISAMQIKNWILFSERIIWGIIYLLVRMILCHEPEASGIIHQSEYVTAIIRE